MPDKSYKKLIVIHGLGGSYTEAIQKILNLQKLKFKYHENAFYMDSVTAQVIRNILKERNAGNIMKYLQRYIIGKMLISGTSHKAENQDIDIEKASRITWTTLEKEFQDTGLPFGAEESYHYGRHTAFRAFKKLRPVFKRLRALLETSSADGRMFMNMEEEEIKSHLNQIENDWQDSDDMKEEKFTDFLTSLRDMHESGGDLDTVASAAFYTFYLQKKSLQDNQLLRYGTDYKYVYVNYHQGLKHLIPEGPGELYMADFPSGAIPDLENDIRELYQAGIFLKRFEDHHPYNQNHLKAFEKLKAEGIIGMYALSGEYQEDEKNGEDNQTSPDGDLSNEPSCGADMVFHSCLETLNFTTEGALTLKKAAHSEDFVTDRHELGMVLTSLIKGGICKIELVNLLVKALNDNLFKEKLIENGFWQISREWNQFFKEAETHLLENVYMITVKRPSGASSLTGGKSLGIGSDAVISKPVSLSETSEITEIGKNQLSHPQTLSIVTALAYFSEPGEPKITTGKAVSFYKEKFPDADYIFYCYGSNLMVARRLNQADYSINLGKLMPVLGSDGDGGHGGAAVGRPSANAQYPEQIIGKSVSENNFRKFVKYLASRLNQTGINVLKVKDLSTVKLKKQHSPKPLMITVLISFIVGLILLLFSDGYDISDIISSNKDFFPYIQVEHFKAGNRPVNKNHNKDDHFDKDEKGLK